MRISRTVIRGKRIGRKLGFKTLNFRPGKLNNLISFGVYICKIGNFFGLLHFGPKKTFNEISSALEIHLLNFNKNIYGKKVFINIIKKIRDVKKFKNLTDLKNEIKKDIKILKTCYNLK